MGQDPSRHLPKRIIGLVLLLHVRQTPSSMMTVVIVGRVGRRRWSATAADWCDRNPAEIRIGENIRGTMMHAPQSPPHFLALLNLPGFTLPCPPALPPSHMARSPCPGTTHDQWLARATLYLGPGPGQLMAHTHAEVVHRSGVSPWHLLHVRRASVGAPTRRGPVSCTHFIGSIDMASVARLIADR